MWKDPVTEEIFVVNRRTGNSYPQAFAPVGETNEGRDGPVHSRRTLDRTHIPTVNDSEKGNNDLPGWIQEALEVLHTMIFSSIRIINFNVTGEPSVCVDGAPNSLIRNIFCTRISYTTRGFFTKVLWWTRPRPLQYILSD